MALERIGIGGILKFSADRAIGGMKKAGVAFGNLRKRAGKVGAGVSKMSGGIAAGSLALGGLSVGVALMAGSAAKFESQMSSVNAILDTTSRERLPELTDLAKKMGAQTSFSATQAGQGIEAMARSGASAQNIMDGLGGVLNAAAADGIELGSAAGIVSNIVNGMGLQFKDATRVADVLAKTSASSATNITLLGESFKMVSAQSKEMGVDLETTAAALGAIADSGLKGTLGGTSFANMMVKLTKPTGEAKKVMKKFGISLTNADGKMRDIFDITTDFGKALGSIKNEAERSRLSTEIFGIRGKKAFSALNQALKNPNKNLQDLRDKIRASAGAAADMAKVRLDNLIGAFTLFKSAAEGLFIEVFGPMLPFIKRGLQGITTALQQVVRGVQLLTKPGEQGRKEFKKLGDTTKAVARGIHDAIIFLNKGFLKMVSLFKQASDFVKSKLGPTGIRAFSKWSLVIGIAAAALAPFAIALGAIVVIIVTAVVPAISGLITVLAAIAKPVLIIATVGVLAWKLFGREISTFASGLRSGLMPILDLLKQVWVNLITAVQAAFTRLSVAWNGGTKSMGTDFTTLGQVVGFAIFTIIDLASSLLVKIITVASKMIAMAFAVKNALWTGIQAPLKFLMDVILNLQDAWTDLVNGSFLKGIAKIGLALVDGILIPMRTIVRMMVKLGQGLGFDVPEKLIRFSEQGFSGLAFGRDDVGAVPAKQTRETVGPPRPSSAARGTASAAKAAKESDKTTKELAEAIRKLPEKQKIEIQNNLCVDGRETAIATERHKVELQDRSGFKATPWQRRMALEAGGVPVAAAG